MDQVMIEEESSLKVKSNDILNKPEVVLRAAIESSTGLYLQVGKIGRKAINSKQIVRGTFECYRDEADFTGFAVRLPGGQIRSFMARNNDARAAFKKWIKTVNTRYFKDPNYEIYPGGVARFDAVV
ncbi:MAG: hypothetical protein K9L31_01295 [Candidatus Pacebacteria bacterium]|nr:hypothetical protein [Candidatus Paceibacterota bacterium]